MTCSDNYLGAEGAKVLAEALRENEGLRELQVRPASHGYISVCF